MDRIALVVASIVPWIKSKIKSSIKVLLIQNQILFVEIFFN